MLPGNSAVELFLPDAVRQSNRPGASGSSGMLCAVRRSAMVVLLAMFTAAMGPLPCRAQTQSPGQNNSSQLAGKVLDPTGAAIAGARITATPPAGRATVSAISGASGDFSLRLDSGATYTLRISAKGFREVSEMVTLASPVERKFVLPVAGPSGVITVTEPADYLVTAISSSTKTLTPLRDIPQSVTVVSQELIKDQLMTSMSDVVRYVPGISSHQGENNRDQVVIRGNSSSADFYLNGMRDDVQYYRDLYNLDRVEALKGPNAMTFGRGGGGGIINRVTKEAGFTPLRELTLMGGSYSDKRFLADFDQPLNDRIAFRLNGMYENSDSFRNYVNLERYGINPTMTFSTGEQTKLTVGYEYLRDQRVADRGIPSFQGLPLDIPISTYFGNPNDSRVRARVNLGSASVEHTQGHWTIRDRMMIGDYDRGYQNFVPGAVISEAGTLFPPTTTPPAGGTCSTRPMSPTRPAPGRSAIPCWRASKWAANSRTISATRAISTTRSPPSWCPWPIPRSIRR